MKACSYFTVIIIHNFREDIIYCDVLFHDMKLILIVIGDSVHISVPYHHTVSLWFNPELWALSCVLVDPFILSCFLPSPKNIPAADFILCVNVHVCMLYHPVCISTSCSLLVGQGSATNCNFSLLLWSVMFLITDWVCHRPNQLFIDQLTLSLFHISDSWPDLLICLPWFSW